MAPTPAGRRGPTLSTASTARLAAALCLLSALAYAANHVLLRSVALELHPAWATCLRESVSAIALGPWLLWLTVAGRRPWPTGAALARLAALGLMVQFTGNLSLQWAFGTVGLAVSVPTMFATLLTGSALLGRVLLGERVSRRSVASIALLILSIALLSVGAGEAHEAVRAGPGSPGGAGLALAGVGAAALAGLSYAGMAVMIRGSLQKGVRADVTIFVVTATGIVAMGSLSLARAGIDRLLATPSSQVGIVLLAGAVNLVAFAALTGGLRLASVLRVGVINATQVAMGAFAGVLLFSEPPATPVIIGIVLTVAGVLLDSGGEPPVEPAEAEDGPRSR